MEGSGFADWRLRTLVVDGLEEPWLKTCVLETSKSSDQV